MTEMMISVSDRYFKALSDLDRDAYLSCFNREVELFDPNDRKPYKRHEGLAKWFSGMERTWSEIYMKPIARFKSGDRIAIHWQAKGSAGSGKKAEFSGINVFTIDKSGLIAHLEGYWNLQSMLAQIS